MANGFIDKARITVRAGNGGNGAVAFHREKYVAAGGPDGGDGGDGGSIILRADSRLLSLYDFRIMRHYEAQNGQGGMGSQRYGRKGEDLVLNLPVGTLVFEQTPEGEHMLTDLAEAGDEYLVVRGGRGGCGSIGGRSTVGVYSGAVWSCLSVAAWPPIFSVFW